MRPEPGDIQILISKYRTMGIEELEASINDWEGKNDCSIQQENLAIAKNELKLNTKREKNK